MFFCSFFVLLPYFPLFFFFFFNDTATTEIYTLSLHDALPISPIAGSLQTGDRRVRPRLGLRHGTPLASRDVPGERGRWSGCLWNLGVFSERCTEKLPLRVDFIHRVEFGEVSGHRVLIKRGPGNRGPTECGTTHEATSGMSS